MQIDGITDFNMLLGPKFYVSSSYYKRYLSHVEFSVTVIEKGTQTTINATETAVTSEYDYVVSFLPGSPRMFKPGLPFTIKVYKNTNVWSYQIAILQISTFAYIGQCNDS